MEKVKRSLVRLLFLFACGAAPIQSGSADGPTRVVVDDLVLVLEGCKLVVGDRVFELDMPGTCRFSVGRDGKPGVRQTEFGTCVVIMSINPIEGSDDCDTYLKGALVRDGEVRVSKHHQHIAMCDDGPLDEKTYAIFAYQIAPLFKE